MKYSFRWVLIPIALLLIIGITHGCSGGDNPATPGNQNPEDAIRLTLQTPSETITDGAEVSIPILLSNANNLYAFSFRVEYDTYGADPIEVDWGEFRVENDVVFNPTDQPGLLPIAYSMIDGSGHDGDQKVCTLKFRVLDPAKFNVRIVTDEEYLVGYDFKHERLHLVAGGEV